MRPYSQDLRDRVIAALETHHDTQAAVAEQFGIAGSTLEKWWARWQTTGSSAALPAAHGPTRVLHGCAAFLRAAVKKQPDATLAELGEQLQTTKHVTASVSMVCRELRLLRLPLKKKASMIASARRAASGANARVSNKISWLRSARSCGA